MSRRDPRLRPIHRQTGFRGEGHTMDTERDYDYTDWDAVTRFAKAFVSNGEETPRLAIAL
jgi:hypothetical protein